MVFMFCSCFGGLNWLSVLDGHRCNAAQSVPQASENAPQQSTEKQNSRSPRSPKQPSDGGRRKKGADMESTSSREDIRTLRLKKVCTSPLLAFRVQSIASVSLPVCCCHLHFCLQLHMLFGINYSSLGIQYISHILREQESTGNKNQQRYKISRTIGILLNQSNLTHGFKAQVIHGF